MQDMILLGFLMDRDYTGYEIKKRMEESTVFFFNTSLGSIYPAFNKLEKNEMVKVKETVEKGRLRKSYSITPKGRRAFMAWLEESATVGKIRDEALLKVFFFSHLPLDKRKSSVDAYLEALEKHRNELQELHEFFVSTRSKCDQFKLTPLVYGIDHFTFLHSWFVRYRKEMEGLTDPGSE